MPWLGEIYDATDTQDVARTALKIPLPARRPTTEPGGYPIESGVRNTYRHRFTSQSAMSRTRNGDHDAQSDQNIEGTHRQTFTDVLAIRTSISKPTEDRDTEVEGVLQPTFTDQPAVDLSTCARTVSRSASENDPEDKADTNSDDTSDAEPYMQEFEEVFQPTFTDQPVVKASTPVRSVSRSTSENDPDDEFDDEADDEPDAEP
jgi:hypothetical protein